MHIRSKIHVILNHNKYINLFILRNVAVFFPDNKFRTYLITYPSDSTDYINAVTIPVSRS